MLTSFTAFLFLCCFFSHCLSRPISSDSSNGAIASARELGEEWFHHQHHHHSRFFAHSPLPANWHNKPWSFVHPPMHNGGLNWFAHGPTTDKHWAFAHAPMSHDWKWHHHWPIVHSPYPCPWWPNKGSETVEVAADQIEAAAAPPLAA